MRLPINAINWVAILVILIAVISLISPFAFFQTSFGLAVMATAVLVILLTSTKIQLEATLFRRLVSALLVLSLILLLFSLVNIYEGRDLAEWGVQLIDLPLLTLAVLFRFVVNWNTRNN